MTLFQLLGQETCIDWLYSDHFERFPKLQICLSECGVGWVPAVLGLAEWSYTMAIERSPQPGLDENKTVPGARDDNEESQRVAALVEARRSQTINRRAPREVFRDHIFVCLIEEVHGIQFYEEIGLDNIMIETDFPHTATRWPNSIEYARRATPGMRESDRARVFNGNAKRLFGLGAEGSRQKDEWRSSRPAPLEIVDVSDRAAINVAEMGNADSATAQSKMSFGMRTRARV
jgi:predicted TIM-barrel fold metal-dependent hydrolase